MAEIKTMENSSLDYLEEQVKLGQEILDKMGVSALYKYSL